jgi:hypothetical protein
MMFSYLSSIYFKIFLCKCSMLSDILLFVLEKKDTSYSHTFNANTSDSPSFNTSWRANKKFYRFLDSWRGRTNCPSGHIFLGTNATCTTWKNSGKICSRQRCRSTRVFWGYQRHHKSLQGEFVLRSRKEDKVHG